MKKASNVKAKKKSLYYTARYLPTKKTKENEEETQKWRGEGN